MAVEAVNVRHPLEAQRHLGERSERSPDGDAVPRGKGGDATDVIGVLVGDEDRAERRRLEPEARETQHRVLDAESAVDEHARVAGFDDQTVAIAAAAK